MRNTIADPKEARSLRRNYIELLVPAGTPEALTEKGIGFTAPFLREELKIKDKM